MQVDVSYLCGCLHDSQITRETSISVHKLTCRFVGELDTSSSDGTDRDSDRKEATRATHDSHTNTVVIHAKQFFLK